MKKEFVILNDKMIYDNNYKSLENSLFSIMYFQQIHPKAKFNIETRSIYFGTGRGLGNSTAVQKLIINYFSNALFIFPTLMATHHHQKIFETYHKITLSKEKSHDSYIFTSLYTNTDKLRGKRFEAIIIENHSLFNPQDQNHISSIIQNHSYEETIFFYIK
jgi:hypothetical protein